MEEDAVLVVLEGIVYLLVPDDPPIGRLGLISLVPLPTLTALTETSTSLIQNVFPTKSFASTAAP